MFITGLLELIFTLRKTGPAKAGAAGLFLLAVINALEITLLYWYNQVIILTLILRLPNYQWWLITYPYSK